MKVSQAEPTVAQPGKDWHKTQFANLIRYVPSGKYYARLRVNGKLIVKSLKTKTISVAKLRLSDIEKHERRVAEQGRTSADGKILFAHALAAYLAKGFRPVTARNKKDARMLKPASVAYYEQRVDALLESWPGQAHVAKTKWADYKTDHPQATWGGFKQANWAKYKLAQTEIRKLTEDDCKAWADKARQKMSPTAFNHTLGVLRNVIDFGIKASARYDNPAKTVMRESELEKPLELPDVETFEAFVSEVENGGGGFSQPCAELVRFMAYGGLRKGEAAFVSFGDCDFDRNQITVRGHPKTGLKNRKLGEVRRVPMIPEMKALLERLKAERPDVKPDDLVMQVRECQKAMDRAAKVVGMKRITHHDLRHLFATRCIESGVDVPTVSRWLGHKDGGALAMRVYGHLRDQHSAAMAQKVTFGRG